MNSKISHISKTINNYIDIINPFTKSYLRHELFYPKTNLSEKYIENDVVHKMAKYVFLTGATIKIITKMM